VHRGTGRSRWGSDDGMTMAEVMVAMLILGIVLSGLAAVMMSSMRAIVKNEREVRSTSLAQQTIEELQSVEWQAAGLYTSEAAIAGSPWADEVTSDSFEGEELVLLPDYPTLDARLEQVPEPVSVVTHAGVEYTVLRYVTFVDTDGDDALDTKRFTAIVRWSDQAGHPRELRATGERVPTQDEAPSTATGARVLAFTVSPDPVVLDAEAKNTGGLSVTVRTNQAIETTPAPELRYYTLADSSQEPVLRTQTLTGSDGSTVWRTTIPSGYRWVNGPVDLLFVARDTGDEILEAYGSVYFMDGPYDGSLPRPVGDSASEPTYPNPPTAADPGATEPDPDEPALPDDDVEIVSVTASPTPLCVNNSNWALRTTTTVTVTVKGMRGGWDTLSVSYDAYNRKNATVVRLTDSATFDQGTTSNATYKAVLPAGQRFFKPGTSVRFEAKANRTDGDNALLESDYVTVSSGC
jgi:prepilin-type N-terminal cleavage/methylation domain-containing protein